MKNETIEAWRMNCNPLGTRSGQNAKEKYHVPFVRGKILRGPQDDNIYPFGA
jgi:hypothetical protein